MNKAGLLTLGLIGFPLSHSFSKGYFERKFDREGINNYRYELFPLSTIESFHQLFEQNRSIVGLNVTIPYKELVIPYLDELSPEARTIGAVNTIKRVNEKLKGYNTDVFGFEKSLLAFLGLQSSDIELSSAKTQLQALVLGSGGAAKAVGYVLKKIHIPYLIVSRKAGKADLTYEDMNKRIIEDHQLIINTTPLGMFPDTDAAPSLPYQFLNSTHFLYDLVYNPEKTVFLNHGFHQASQIKNGLDMLHLQAEKAWDIWTSEEII